MAFEGLTSKLQSVFKNLRNKGRLTENDVKEALKEVKMALLEADVNFRVVKQFMNAVTERAVGQDVLTGLNPGQMVIKIVNEEMIKLMGSETTEIALRPGNEITVIMMVGLQGAGKTTTAAKLAGKMKQKGRKPLLVACDVYRPAAIEQLQTNGRKQGVEVFSMGTDVRPVNIAKAAYAHAKENGYNVMFIDTAGRLQIDEDMMNELKEIKSEIAVDHSILVVDAMTGQEAVNVSKTFDEILDAFENHKNPVLYCSNINGFIDVYLRMSAENVMRSAFGATPTASIAFSSSYENKIFRASCLNGTWSMATFEMTAS